MSDRPMALSVERVRHEMLRGILVPREMVNAALQTTYAKLQAKETKFFSYKGHVTQKAEVDDHGTQLAAADQIFSLAGLYAREREERAGTPGVALEIDPVSGVIRLIVGSAGPPELSSNGVLSNLQDVGSPVPQGQFGSGPVMEPMRELPPSIPSRSEGLVGYPPSDESLQPSARIRRLAVSDTAWKVLLDEEV